MPAGGERESTAVSNATPIPFGAMFGLVTLPNFDALMSALLALDVECANAGDAPAVVGRRIVAPSAQPAVRSAFFVKQIPRRCASRDDASVSNRVPNSGPLLDGCVTSPCRSISRSHDTSKIGRAHV